MSDEQAPLTAYRLDDSPLMARPAPVERDWMEATGNRFAYRCLPLNIANAHGWELLCPVGFAAGWTGGPGLESVVVQVDGGAPAPATSHFGSGILTFHVPVLFRTPLGQDLWVQGPVNRPKDGIYPLTGVVETDWAVSTFTMNWIFTRPGILLRFEAGEPFCHLFPVARDGLAQVTPRIARLADEPALQSDYQRWSESRNQFNQDLKSQGSGAQTQGWQKNYYRGETADGAAAADGSHRTRIRLKPFE